MRIVSPIIEYFVANKMCKDYTSIEGEMTTLVRLNFPLTASIQAPIYFDSQSILDGDNCTITGIELVSRTELVAAPNGDGTLDDIYYNKGILYIANLKRDTIAELPLTSLIRDLNNGKLKFTNFNDQVWQNCYLEFTDGGFSSPTIPLLFNVYYVPKIKE
jgi:hypothetical protein